MQRSLRGMCFEPHMNEILEKRKFSTAEHIVGRPVIELLHDLDLPLPLILDIVRIISIKISPPSTTVMDLLHKKGQSGYVPTQLPILDAYLRGGLSFGTLTEVGFPRIFD